jgi:hypothetical protein
MVSKDQLKDAEHVNLIRFAKYIGLRNNLTEMSKKNLVKLILWKLRKDDPFEVKSGCR